MFSQYPAHVEIEVDLSECLIAILLHLFSDYTIEMPQKNQHNH